MPLPPTRYINAGPGLPQANASAAAATGDAMARLGETIRQVGDRGFALAEKVRRAEEAGVMSAFMANLDEEAAKFSIELMRRDDTDAWPSEWRAFMEEAKQNLNGQNLSPEARANAALEVQAWGTRRTIQLETQAAVKSLEMARARGLHAADYYMSRGKAEEARGELSRLREGGVLSEVEYDQGLLRLDEQEFEFEMDDLVQTDPRAALEMAKKPTFLDENPAATRNSQLAIQRKAKIKIQEFRGEELETLDTALLSGELRQRDIEGAEYLTKQDRIKLHHALGRNDPPSNADWTASWEILATLREARNDVGITQEQYWELFNEARASTLARIPSQWAGPLNRELNYLSPAGRSPAGGPGGAGGGRDSGATAAEGRAVVDRALRAGLLGDTSTTAPYPVSEAAHRKAKDFRDAVTDYATQHPEKTIPEIRAYADSLIAGKRVPAAARQVDLPGRRMQPDTSSPGVLPPIDLGRETRRFLNDE